MITSFEYLLVLALLLVSMARAQNASWSDWNATPCHATNASDCDNTTFYYTYYSDVCRLFSFLFVLAHP
jgi:hypothetical protein